MSNSTLVYNSTPGGSDLTFTFSTVQNGSNLSFTGTTFLFYLYDSREDLIGTVADDVAAEIIVIDSTVDPGPFTLDEAAQTVVITVPWEEIELYQDALSSSGSSDEEFIGDTFGVLRATGVT